MNGVIGFAMLALTGAAVLYLAWKLLGTRRIDVEAEIQEAAKALNLAERSVPADERQELEGMELFFRAEGEREGVAIRLDAFRSLRTTREERRRPRSFRTRVALLIRPPLELGLRLARRPYGDRKPSPGGPSIVVELERLFRVDAADPKNAAALLGAPDVVKALRATAGGEIELNMRDEDVSFWFAGAEVSPVALLARVHAGLPVVGSLARVRERRGHRPVDAAIDAALLEVADLHGLEWTGGELRGIAHATPVLITLGVDQGKRVTNLQSRFDIPLGVDLQLTVTGRIGESPGDASLVATGDPQFASRFVVRSSAPGRVANALSRDVRAALLSLESRCVDLYMLDDGVRLALPSSEDSAALDMVLSEVALVCTALQRALATHQTAFRD